MATISVPDGKTGKLKKITDPYYLPDKSPIRDEIVAYGDNNRYANLSDFYTKFNKYFDSVSGLKDTFNTGLNSAKEAYKKFVTNGAIDYGGGYQQLHAAELADLKSKYGNLDVNNVNDMLLFAKEFKDPGSASGYGGISINGENLKKMANQWINSNTNVDASKQEGYSTDLTATNYAMREADVKRQQTYMNLRDMTGKTFGYNPEQGGLSADLFPTPKTTEESSTIRREMTYTIQPGDTLSDIARRYGVSVDQITGYKSGNPNLIYPGEIINLGTFEDIPNPAYIEQKINSKQDQTIAELENQDIPGNEASILPVNGSGQSVVDTSQFQSSSSVPQFSYQDMFNQQIATSGVNDLESMMSSLENEARVTQERMLARQEYEASKPQSMSVIGGKQSEIARQEQMIYESLQRQKAYVSEQLQTKYQMIQMSMQYAQMDYEMAKDNYDRNYKQQMDMINYMQEERAYELDLNKEQQKIAMTNLNVLTKQIEAGDFGFNDLDENTKLMINNLEVQAGLPIGFTSLIKSKNPSDEVLSNTTRVDPTGAKYADVLFRNKSTGEVSTFSFYLGGVAVGGASGGSSGGSSGRSSGGSSKKSSSSSATNYWSDDASYFVSQLDSGSMNWGDAWNQMKTIFPDASNSQIDEALGGGYDDVSGIWYGRAASEERKAGTTTEIADGLYQYSNAWGDYILPSF